MGTALTDTEALAEAREALPVELARRVGGVVVLNNEGPDQHPTEEGTGEERSVTSAVL